MFTQLCSITICLERKNNGFSITLYSSSSHTSSLSLSHYHCFISFLHWVCHIFSTLADNKSTQKLAANYFCHFYFRTRGTGKTTLLINSGVRWTIKEKKNLCLYFFLYLYPAWRLPEKVQKFKKWQWSCDRKKRSLHKHFLNKHSCLDLCFGRLCQAELESSSKSALSQVQEVSSDFEPGWNVLLCSFLNCKPSAHPESTETANDLKTENTTAEIMWDTETTGIKRGITSIKGQKS